MASKRLSIDQRDFEYLQYIKEYNYLFTSGYKDAFKFGDALKYGDVFECPSIRAKILVEPRGDSGAQEVEKDFVFVGDRIVVIYYGLSLKFQFSGGKWEMSEDLPPVEWFGTDKYVFFGAKNLDYALPVIIPESLCYFKYRGDECPVLDVGLKFVSLVTVQEPEPGSSESLCELTLLQDFHGALTKRVLKCHVGIQELLRPREVKLLVRINAEKFMRMVDSQKPSGGDQ